MVLLQESARHQAEVDELKEKIENNSQQLKSLQENERAKAKVGGKKKLWLEKQRGSVISGTIVSLLLIQINH